MDVGKRREEGGSVHPLHAWVGAGFVVPCSVVDKCWFSWEGHVIGVIARNLVYRMSIVDCLDP